MATGDGVLEVTAEGRVTTVVQLDTTVGYPNSLVEQPDGTIWLGLRGGAIRFTPAWPDPHVTGPNTSSQSTRSWRGPSPTASRVADA